MALFEKGMKVWTNTAYAAAKPAEIIGISYVSDPRHKDRKIPYYRVHGIDGNYGTYGVKAENAFLSKQEALDAQNAKDRSRVKGYMENIRTPLDLVEFCIGHMHGEDTDYEAVKAAEKMKELFMEKGEL